MLFADYYGCPSIRYREGPSNAMLFADDYGCPSIRYREGPSNAMLFVDDFVVCEDYRDVVEEQLELLRDAMESK